MAHSGELAEKTYNGAISESVVSERTGTPCGGGSSSSSSSPNWVRSDCGRGMTSRSSESEES